MMAPGKGRAPRGVNEDLSRASDLVAATGSALGRPLHLLATTTSNVDQIGLRADFCAVRPMNCGSNCVTNRRSAAGSSCAGSTVTISTRTPEDFGRVRYAFANVASASGHASLQCVYPKKTKVASEFAVTSCAGWPRWSTSVVAGTLRSGTNGVPRSASYACRLVHAEYTWTPTMSATSVPSAVLMIPP